MNASDFSVVGSPDVAQVYRLTTILRQYILLDVKPTVAPNRQTVVLLHGFNFSGEAWRGTIDVLTKSKFVVLRKPARSEWRPRDRSPRKAGYCLREFRL